MITSGDLPVYAGFIRTIVDQNGESLNHRANHLVKVNGAHRTADYFEENDLRYDLRAILYHLDRIIEFYVFYTQTQETHSPPGHALQAVACDPRIAFELDAFFSAARRAYESISKVLWKHFNSHSNGRWRSIRTALKSTDFIPTNYHQVLSDSWASFGEKLGDYRDCVAHNDPVTENLTPGWLDWYGNRWGMTVKLPANPQSKSRTKFDFEMGPDALNYCHDTACHLVDISEGLMALEKIRMHLDNPRRSPSK